MNVIILCYPFCHYNRDKSNVKYTESATTTTIAAVFKKSNVSPRESATMTRIAIVFNEELLSFLQFKNIDKTNIQSTKSATTTTRIAIVFNKANIPPRESATMTRITIAFNKELLSFTI